MKDATMEIRIWEGSPIAGMKVSDVSDRFGITILKATRGHEARNPDRNVILNEADYIYFVGSREQCLEFVKYAGSD